MARNLILIDALPASRDEATVTTIRDALTHTLNVRSYDFDLSVEVLRVAPHGRDVTIRNSIDRQLKFREILAADFIGYLYRSQADELRLAVTKDRYGVQTDFTFAGM